MSGDSPLLTVEHLNARYGRARILTDIDLAVDPGQVLAVIGRNGAGKSTIFKSIMGLVADRWGRVTFAGIDIAARGPAPIARLGLGYVPEDRRIFKDLTVMENLAVGRRPARPGLPCWTPERLFTLFPNLAEMRHRPGGRMSGGEQQMLTIARTLMGNPRLVMLDEPSEGLAPRIVEMMALAILELKREGLAVMLSEQNLHFAALVSDRAVVIEKGQVRFHGAMAALVDDAAVRQTYLMV
ncbi:MAG: ABC transporter ATP-binding protein [Azospirillaceae bacterium]|nr:ABC transporter ATP-binding protein [Azospirillaceae bacterium]